MTYENQKAERIEVPKPGFQEIELFGGFESELREDTDKLEAYQAERAALAEQGDPTFIVKEFFEDGYDMWYFVNNVHVANIHYTTDKEKSSFVYMFGYGKSQEVGAIEEAINIVKAVGYVEKSA